MRFTGLRPIEKNGLKGFGFTVSFGAETDASSHDALAGSSDSLRSPVLYPASRDTLPRDEAGAGDVPPAEPAPVQFYDGFVEPKCEVWRK